MKRLWISAVLIAAVAAVCVWESCFLKSFSTEIDNAFDRVEKEYAAENYIGAEKTAKDIEQRWLEAENILCHFVSIERLYEVGTAVSGLPHLACSKNDDFYVECRRMRIQLKHMLNGEKVTVF